MQWIISDIHGCVFTLEALLNKITKTDSSPFFIFVGDYVDRGKNSKQAVEFLIGLKDAIFILGNHDDIVCYLLNDFCRGDLKEMVMAEPSIDSVACWWIMNGFVPTLQSYGLSQSDPLGRFREVVPFEHKEFLSNCRLFWQNDTHFVCHAYWRIDEQFPSGAIKQDMIMEMLWTRFPRNDQNGGLYLKHEPVWDKIGVFGHTPLHYYGVSEPIKQSKLRLIDTGAFRGKSMAAYCCETDDFVTEQTDVRDIWNL